MDIARLGSAGYATPNYPVPSRSRARVLDLVAEVDAARPTQATVERVVQGEVLQRQRAVYSSTQDYLNRRVFDGAYAAADEGADGNAQRSTASYSGYALGAYLSNTSELIQPDVNRGKQVDYFI